MSTTTAPAASTLQPNLGIPLSPRYMRAGVDSERRDGVCGQRRHTARGAGAVGSTLHHAATHCNALPNTVAVWDRHDDDLACAPRLKTQTETQHNAVHTATHTTTHTLQDTIQDTLHDALLDTLLRWL